jgi:hypothetical protein
LVEIASRIEPRRTMPPRYALADAMSSTALTNRPRAVAAAATSRLTSGGAAATTQRAPSRSLATKLRSTSVTSSARISSQISGATTVIRAPAAIRPASLLAAIGPPPTTTTGRPASFKNTG